MTTCSQSREQAGFSHWEKGGDMRAIGARLRLATTTVATIVLALCTASAVSASVTVSQSGWAWGNPSPQGNTLNAISFAGPLGYAVGANGTALKTENGGATWSGLATGTSGELGRVQIVDANTVVVGGGDGCILRISTDGGLVFTKIFSVAEASCSDQVQAFSFVSAQVGFLLLRNGSVLATQDGGNTFSRQTGIPGTAASSGGGGNVGIDIHFTSPTEGIVLAGPASGGQSNEYKTADGGVSWTPVSLPSANVTGVHFIDATHAFAFGPSTLLSSSDAGATWKSQAISASNNFTGIDCADAKTCVLTVAGGAQLVRTTDGGASSSVITPSSAPILGAAYSTSTRVVGVGVGGATVTSDDGGVTFASASRDVGGQYSRLRSGPAGLVYAPGTNGTLAISRDGGASWGTLATQTSANLRDVSFASPEVGYVLDTSGGLQLTTNSGASWRTLDPGTTTPADTVAAVSDNSVLLVGPVGVYRSVAGGRFNPVGGRAASARVSEVDVAGSATFAYGPRTLLRSTNGGASWSALRLPLTNRKGRSPITIRSASFIGAASGMLLDVSGRLWRTSNGGRSWSELLSTGTSNATSVHFADPLHAFLTLSSYGGDSSNAYVLHTADGGASWHPQLIAAGTVQAAGLVAEGASNAFALVDGPGGQDERQLFFTTSGGDAGTPSALTLATRSTRIAKRKLRRAHDLVRIDGVLAGAQGGERIVVSRRNLSGGPWQHQVATAGANGGSFTTTWRIGGSSVFVAQWAGDSGRASLGSRVLRINVH
jgi:photosystem II stability/assembly factor-like uncharacterized protein